MRAIVSAMSKVKKPDCRRGSFAPGIWSNELPRSAGVIRSASAPSGVVAYQESRCVTEPAARLSTSVNSTPKSTLLTKLVSNSRLPDRRPWLMSIFEKLLTNTLPVTDMSSGLSGSLKPSSRTGNSLPK